MKKSLVFIAVTLCFFFSSCRRPIAYFQPTPRPGAARLPINKPDTLAQVAVHDSVVEQPEELLAILPAAVPIHTASQKRTPSQTTENQVEQRMLRVQKMLTESTQSTDKQPDPKSKKKLKLGNQIRQSLGIPLRKELNWWQSISWKLKASVIIILVAVLFAILKITTLALIFGIIGAFLMISGLKRSFKVKRPWF